MALPHLMLQYSGNLERRIDMAALCEALRARAAQMDVFPLAGIRVRAIRVDHYAIADGNPSHGFVDIVIRLRKGRSPEQKSQATEAIFSTARQFLEPAMRAHPLALSLELREIDPDYAPKTGTIRNFLEVGS